MNAIYQPHQQAPMPHPVEYKKTRDLHNYSASFHNSSSPERDNLEAAIRETYQEVYGAQLLPGDYLPLLLDLKIAGSLNAVVGLRPGKQEKNLDNMLVQKYLDKPLDQKIAEVIRQPVTRDELMEIGNLVSVKRGGSQILFILLAAVLEAAGYQWMVFTGTPTVKKLINRLGYEPFVLHEAKADLLGAAAERWGTYYLTQPKVMLVNIRAAMATVRQHELIADLLQSQHRIIDSLGKQLRDYRRLSGKHHAE